MTRSTLLSTLYTLGLGLGGIGALIALTDLRALFASFVSPAPASFLVPLANVHAAFRQQFFDAR
ncbi:MAG: hypothetical protein HY327_05690 [Chloroflexi bacterium]|nr:hypothetical protein [Chloroflexota bacterium]